MAARVQNVFPRVQNSKRFLASAESITSDVWTVAASIALRRHTCRRSSIGFVYLLAQFYTQPRMSAIRCSSCRKTGSRFTTSAVSTLTSGSAGCCEVTPRWDLICDELLIDHYYQLCRSKFRNQQIPRVCCRAAPRAHLRGAAHALEDVASGCSPASLRPSPVRKLALVAELCLFLSCLCPPSDGSARWFRGQGEPAAAYEASQVDPAAAAGRSTVDPSVHATRHARAATGGAYTTSGALVLRCANGAHNVVCARARRRARDHARTSSTRYWTTLYHPAVDLERIARQDGAAFAVAGRNHHRVRKRPFVDINARAARHNRERRKPERGSGPAQRHCGSGHSREAAARRSGARACVGRVGRARCRIGIWSCCGTKAFLPCSVV